MRKNAYSPIASYDTEKGKIKSKGRIGRVLTLQKRKKEKEREEERECLIRSFSIVDTEKEEAVVKVEIEA